MRASVKGLLGTLIRDPFLAPRHSLLFWTVCVSFDGNNFSLQFLEGRFYCFIRNHTVLHHESRELATVSASLAVISTASKHLHNDLARAIEALEQKKAQVPSNLERICLLGFTKEAGWPLSLSVANVPNFPFSVNPPELRIPITNSSELSRRIASVTFFRLSPSWLLPSGSTGWSMNKRIVQKHA